MKTVVILSFNFNMENLDQYKAQWKDIAEKLAYMTFTGPAYEILSSRNFSHEDIQKFNVTIYCRIFSDEENGNDIEDITVRFSVFLGSKNNTEEITLQFTNKIIINALINKIYDGKYGVYQQYDFEFGRPNAIELYDAEYYLMELLKLEAV